MLRYEGWSLLGRLSDHLAARFGPTLRPVLLLSLPRSGSSWIGSILGSANNAAYLREPVTQSFVSRGNAATVRTVGRSPGDDAYRLLVSRALRGLPPFSANITPYPEQWRLGGLCNKAVVVKEVNPLAIDLYLEMAEPFVVLLVRHPAAVALSHERLGWLGNPDTVEGSTKHGSVWLRNGWRQAKVIRTAKAALEVYPHYLIVRYEDLCSDPIPNFIGIAEAAGLVIGDNARRRIKHTTTTTAGASDGGAYGLVRDTARTAESWRERIKPRDLRELHDGFAREELGLYDCPEDWLPS